MRGNGGGARDRNSSVGKWGKLTIQQPVSTKPEMPAGDPEYQQSQPINRDDRRAMLRRHFKTAGMTDAEIDAHLTKKTKV